MTTLVRRPSTAEGERPLVVVTTTQLGDIVRNVAGDAAELHQLLQANSDPHDYEPRPDDIEATAGAKVVFESGNELDHWMEEVVKESGGSPVEVEIAPDHTPYKVEGEHEEEEEGHAEEGDEHAESEFDPHWWHDPRNVEAAVGTIRDELAKAAPANAQTYKANAAAYLTKLKALDAGIAGLHGPGARGRAQARHQPRRLQLLHRALRDHGDRGRHPVAVHAGAAVGGRDLRSLRRLSGASRSRRSSRRARSTRSWRRRSRARPGAKADYVLYGDALGPEGSSGDTYLKMEAANADAMVKGFTGDRQGCSIGGL